MSSTKKNPPQVTSKINYQEVCFVIALAMLLLFSIVVWVSDEPFSLFDGISMWPAEFIKMIATWLSLYLLCRAWDKMQQGKRDIENEFKLTASEGKSKNDIHFIWSSYRKGGSLWVRIQRIFPVALAWYFVCKSLYLIQKPNIPFRDYWAFWTDQVLTYLAFIGFLMLFAFVSDATMHCRGFIQKFINEDTIS